jgi:hypothetical protein
MRVVATILALVSLLSLSSRASARTPGEADPPSDLLAPYGRELAADPEPRGHLFFGIHLGVHRSSSRGDAATGMLLLGVPLDHLGRRATLADGLKPALPRARIDPDPPLPAPDPKSARPVIVEAPVLPVVVTPEVARDAVDASVHAAHLADADARMDALATRARSSALLPELHARVARRIDEGQSLSPTEYDPVRTTATGGTMLLLEGRAIWRLDRLVFSDDELAIERLRQERADARAKLTARVLEALFAWQKAIAQAANPAASPEERLAAELKRVECEATLDLLTRAWFTRWNAARVAKEKASEKKPEAPAEAKKSEARG